MGKPPGQRVRAFHKPPIYRSAYTHTCGVFSVIAGPALNLICFSISGLLNQEYKFSKSLHAHCTAYAHTCNALSMIAGPVLDIVCFSMGQATSQTLHLLPQQ